MKELRHGEEINSKLSLISLAIVLNLNSTGSRELVLDIIKTCQILNKRCLKINFTWIKLKTLEKDSYKVHSIRAGNEQKTGRSSAACFITRGRRALASLSAPGPQETVYEARVTVVCWHTNFFHFYWKNPNLQ